MTNSIAGTRPTRGPRKFIKVTVAAAMRSPIYEVRTEYRVSTSATYVNAVQPQGSCCSLWSVYVKNEIHRLHA